MLTVRLLSAVKKPRTGTPGSSAVEQGFDLRIQTSPGLGAFRVAAVWTGDGWRTVRHTECTLIEPRDDADIWTADISFFSTPILTFNYALAAAGAEGVSWDNNGGWNYVI
jgi:hypothetical protein